MNYEVIKNYLYNLLFKLFIYFENIYIAIAAMVVAFLGPIQKIIFLCIVLAIIDLFVKLFVVYKTKGYDEIKSSRINDTLFKIVFYSVSIMTVHGIDMWFVKDIGLDFLKLILKDDTAANLLNFKLAGAIAFVIMLRELKSIDESWAEKFGWSFYQTIESKISLIFRFKK